MHKSSLGFERVRGARRVRTLPDCGFDKRRTIVARNVTKRTMLKTVTNFVTMVEKERETWNKPPVLLFYFSGHGEDVNGKQSVTRECMCFPFSCRVR